MKIEDPKKSSVLPHEYTLSKPKKDRMNLLKTTEANLSPIFSLFRDKENRVNKTLKSAIRIKRPFFTVEKEGVMHKIWKLDNRRSIERIQNAMRDKKVYIADGHHRYEVALTYRNECRKRSASGKNTDFVMMYFSNLSERGNLTILSTHRVVKGIQPFNKKDIISKLEAYFHLARVKSEDALFRALECRNKHVFGMYVGGGKFYVLTLKEEYSVDRLIDSDKARSLKRLDVTILHDLIISKLLSIQNSESSIKYIQSGKDARTLIENGDYELAFFLRPTRVTDMSKIAEKGVMMPQKSTYFYPKLLTGLVINKF
jgi:uncharacterized protein (DUF1015 family)